MHTTQEEIASLEQFAKEAESFAATTRKKLEKLRAKAETRAWGPSAGGFHVSATDRNGWAVATCKLGTHVRSDLGVSYTTREAAEAAKNYLAWYALLLNLAAQVNPSGKPGGTFALWRDQNTWEGGEYLFHRACGQLFENDSAFTKACEILNRQNGVLGGIPCPF